ncbi:hypothetical protein, partial [Nonomuraea sp. NEAU-A123]|uniref:hypothetical protein n=1 Tax=Nonomuraea sp. NEAU-A123 TaxID=2839649 RepID=UPI001BE4145A
MAKAARQETASRLRFHGRTISRSTPSAAPAELTIAGDLAFSTPAELTPAKLTPAELVTSNELIASTDFDFAVPAEVVASAFGSEPRLDVTDPRLVTGVSRSILERLKPLEPIADLLARASAPL